MLALEAVTAHGAGQVLVLCANAWRKQQFAEAWMPRLLTTQGRAMAAPQLYTYAGLVRSTLFDVWPLAEVRLEGFEGQPVIAPRLWGLADTEWVLAQQLACLRANHPEALAPLTDLALTRQLLRRLRLRAENNLSRAEMARRTTALAADTLPPECLAIVAQIEPWFDRWSSQHRMLDTSRQMELFHHLLETSPDAMRAYFASRQVKHLLVDDLDETTPAQQHFIRWLAPMLQSCTLSADPEGGSRRGYLSAFPYDWPGLKRFLCGPDLLPDTCTQRLHRHDAAARNAHTMRNNWYQVPAAMSDATHLPAIQAFSSGVSWYPTTPTRADMWDLVASRVQRHLDGGGTVGQLALVIPQADPLTLQPLHQRLSAMGLAPQHLLGTQGLTAQPAVRFFLRTLQWLHQSAWQWPVSPLELQEMLRFWCLRPGWVRWHSHVAAEATPAWYAAFSEGAPPLEVLEQALGCQLLPPARYRYERLCHWMATAPGLGMSSQIYRLFSEVVSLALEDADAESSDGVAFTQLMESFEHHCFLEAQWHPDLPPLWVARNWVRRVWCGAVADTPDSPQQLDPQRLLISTPQKLIDAEVRRPHQYWLDVGNREWARTDTAPLYDAWVHSAAWPMMTASQAQPPNGDGPMDDQHRDWLTRVRAGHICRALMLLCEHVHCFAAWTDDHGQEAQGPLLYRLPVMAEDALPTLLVPAPALATLLRPDQQPILKIQPGTGETMAVVAVPGAGKTYANVVLVRHLLQTGTPAPRILVLTFMESACRTMLARLRAACQTDVADGALRDMVQGPSQLPVVCTLHGLARRILCDNEAAVAIGFSFFDKQLLDGAEHEALIQTLAASTRPDPNLEPGVWETALKGTLDRLKARQYLHPAPKGARGFASRDITEDLAPALGDASMQAVARALATAYQAYQDSLVQRGLLDFTDLLGLAVRLLESSDASRQRWQTQFDIIIEDEAQDSSPLMQRFIALLRGPCTSFVRAGDLNQSITGFMDADPNGFRAFIARAQHHVSMNYSGRCAPEIIDMANRWVAACQGTAPSDAAAALCAVQMQPVPECNPSLLFPIETPLFARDDLERQAVVSQVKTVLAQHPTATLAVLCRQNQGVRAYTEALHAAGVEAMAVADDAKTAPALAVLLAAMDWVQAPQALPRQQQLCEAMIKAGLWMNTDEREAVWSRVPLWGWSAVVLPEAVRQDTVLLQLHYDLAALVQEATALDPVSWLLKLVDRWLHDPFARSQGYALASLARQEIQKMHMRLGEAMPLGVALLGHLHQALARPKKFGITAAGEGAPPPGSVLVMTLHKAKGQEFDAVWMPGLTQAQFPDSPEVLANQHQKDRGRKLQTQLLAMLETLQTLPPGQEEVVPPQPNTAVHDVHGYYQRQVAEEARLLYVGLTRAKRYLWLSAHQAAPRRQGRRDEPAEPTRAFHVLAAQQVLAQ